MIRDIFIYFSTITTIITITTIMDPTILSLLTDYCGLLYQHIHLSQYQSHFNTLNNFLLSHCYTGTLYRNIHHTPTLRLHPGDIIDYSNRILSWTKELSIADNLRQENLEDANIDGKILCVDFHVVNGFYLEFNNINIHEKEVLLASGIKLRIDKQIDNIWYCHLC